MNQCLQIFKRIHASLLQFLGNSLFLLYFLSLSLSFPLPFSLTQTTNPPKIKEFLPGHPTVTSSSNLGAWQNGSLAPRIKHNSYQKIYIYSREPLAPMAPRYP
uniref:Uncharacterized protein n=1 Tax=Opuntia streptacantha TaxID=393608 RepID=A0A7C9A2A6_OPUST